MDKEKRDQKAREQILMWLQIPTKACDMPMYYRRYLRKMEQEGLIYCDTPDNFQWKLSVTGIEAVLKLRGGKDL